MKSTYQNQEKGGMGEEGRKHKKTKFSSSMIGLPLKGLKCQSVLPCYSEMCRLILKEMFMITYGKLE